MNKRQTREEILAEKRKKRAGHTGNNRLMVDAVYKKKGYAYRIVNDVPGRIERFDQRGWDVVKEKVPMKDPKTGDAQQMGSAVSIPVGGGTNGILMRIEQELYDEDVKTAQDKIDKTASVIEAHLKKEYVTDPSLPVKVGRSE